MYFQMKIVRRQKGEAAKRPGIWLGINERIEETLVGTERGVIKCRTASRVCSDEAWDKELLMKVKGMFWNPVQGEKIRESQWRLRTMVLLWTRVT